ncbi:uncharacterized protein FPRO_02146 [Fusarium proliferatum ET1]|uniref:Zn(2)-C6 fungal-type domain-containing protein n=1 Tax=Fusarium proliferatum (strain ET1) TaxID=1227346 RepID=A0A1L7UYD5_FUSPR|nr:uncharacterized protein FPRO_02146 [Fusarium proliferatum ET1]CZR31660.1 uncharacterized protein FPRO_02146 [Fusarium proliferatum ET1]
MVNTGRPSMDCLPCRRRKLRCDLKPESCGQCRRANISCHGYRNVKDLAFRDQTRVARQKVAARQGHAYQLITLPSPMLDLDLDVEARCRDTFFLLYVTGLSRSCSSLPPLYNQAPISKHLAYSVNAVGLAFSAVQFDSQELVRTAFNRYSAAIGSLRHSLCEPNVLIGDEILQSILLLDIFEKLAAPSLGMPGSSMTHIRGAMSIIESRGKLNFTSALSTQIARNILSHFIISCGMIKTFISDSQVALWRDLSGLIIDSKWDYMGILVDIVNLRAMLAKAIIVDDSETKERLFSIKCRLEYLADSLERSCGPFAVILRDWQALDGEYDAYPNHFTMQLHNAVRMMRLEMEGLIRDRCYERNGEVINKIAKQICRSVTHYIMPKAGRENSEPFTQMQKLECRVLMAPLYQAAQMSTENCVQAWIWRVLEWIAEKGNMRIARDVLELSKKRMDMDYWTIWSMAGCYATAA